MSREYEVEVVREVQQTIRIYVEADSFRRAEKLAVEDVEDGNFVADDIVDEYVMDVEVQEVQCVICNARDEEACTCGKGDSGGDEKADDPNSDGEDSDDDEDDEDFEQEEIEQAIADLLDTDFS